MTKEGIDRMTDTRQGKDTQTHIYETNKQTYGHTHTHTNKQSYANRNTHIKNTHKHKQINKYI